MLNQQTLEKLSCMAWCSSSLTRSQRSPVMAMVSCSFGDATRRGQWPSHGRWWLAVNTQARGISREPQPPEKFHFY